MTQSQIMVTIQSQKKWHMGHKNIFFWLKFSTIYNEISFFYNNFFFWFSDFFLQIGPFSKKIGIFYSVIFNIFKNFKGSYFL